MTHGSKSEFQHWENWVWQFHYNVLKQESWLILIWLNWEKSILPNGEKLIDDHHGQKMFISCNNCLPCILGKVLVSFSQINFPLFCGFLDPENPGGLSSVLGLIVWKQGLGSRHLNLETDVPQVRAFTDMSVMDRRNNQRFVRKYLHRKLSCPVVSSVM